MIDPKELEAAVSRAEDLRGLLVTPGWKHFQQLAQMEIQRATHVMMTSDDPYKVMTARGVAKAIGELVSWPIREVEATETALAGEQSTP